MAPSLRRHLPPALAAALALATTSACERPEKPAATPAAADAAPSPAAKPAVPSDTPAKPPATKPPAPPPTASAVKADPVAPAPLAAKSGPKVRLPVKLVDSAPGAQPFTLFTLAGGAVAISGRRAAALPAAGALEWSSLPDGPEYEGLNFELAGGAWPDAAYFVASMTAPRTTPKRVTLKLNTRAWAKVVEKPMDGVLASLAPWIGGRALAVRHPDMWGGQEEDDFTPRIDVLGGAAPETLPLPAGSRPVAVATSPSGQVFAVMARDEPEDDDVLAGPAHAARLSAANPPVITPMPALDKLTPRANDLRVILALADDDVWLAGGTIDEDKDEWTPYAIHWDGATWTRIALPSLSGGFFASGTRCGGSLWFTTSERLGSSGTWIAGRADRPEVGSLWRRDADGSWRLVDLALDRRAKGEPTGAAYRPTSVACAGDRTLWVSLEPAPESLPVNWDTAQAHVLARAAL